MEIKLILTMEREAKNSVRYREVTPSPHIYGGLVYLYKTSLGEPPYPKELEVVITSASNNVRAIR